MKRRNIWILMLIGLFAFSTVSIAQSQKKEDKKLVKKIKSKATKEARKEAKSFKKQGYAVSPGALPMEKQKGAGPSVARH